MKKYFLKLSYLVFIDILLIPPVHGQPAEWYNQAMKSEEASIPKAENDPTRPVYHFRPPAQWMNDICGAIYYNKYYHIFYQFNPFADEWIGTELCWGHARSKNLTNWEHMPIAIGPQTAIGELRCNSGSIAIDEQGTPLIFYTFVPANDKATRLGKREQWVAKASDKELRDWKRIEQNPILAAGINGVPADIPGGWSDPYVFKSGNRTFVTFKSSDGLLAEAQNKQLTSWKVVGKLEGLKGECPNFFKLKDKWVLLRSTYPPSYLIGSFNMDSLKFTPDQEEPGTLDYVYGPVRPGTFARGFYGTNVLFDKQGRCILFGWVSGFKSGRGWNGCMSLPRILDIDDKGNLTQKPAPELRQLRGKHYKSGIADVNNEEILIENLEGDLMEIIAEFVPGNSDSFGLKLRQSKDGNKAVTIRFSNWTLSVDGTEVPISPYANSGVLKLQVFLDKSVLEVFINDGLACVTRVIYPGEKDLGISIFAENGNIKLKSFDAWEMNSIW